MIHVSLTIGQGAPGQPNYLHADAWARFVTSVDDLLVRYGFELVVQNYGVGAWDGVAERNYIVAGIRDGRWQQQRNEVRDGHWTVAEHAERARFVEDIKRLAERFDQDAVAVSFGDSFLIDQTTLTSASPETADLLDQALTDGDTAAEAAWTNALTVSGQL